MPDFDPNVSPYIRKALERMNQCDCGRGPKRTETEMCSHCEADGQAEIIDSDEMQAHRIYAGGKG